MNKQGWERIVREDGTLDDVQLLRREALYKGRNGKVVERFFMETPAGCQSFIFKPLTNLETMGREQWAERCLLPYIAVRTPRLLATAAHHVSERYWAIFEDLGYLPPVKDDSAFVEAAKAVATWHGLALSIVPQTFSGHSPSLGDVGGYVDSHWQQLYQIILKTSFSPKLLDAIRRGVDKREDLADAERVVSHGDYHPSNVSFQAGQLVVIDWEYAHQNSVYWDLYNLLDITSPRYRRCSNRDVRRAALASYANARDNEYQQQFERFMRNYHLFAAIYSAWILLLIDNDMKSTLFDMKELLLQQSETINILRDCAMYLE